MRTKTSLPPPAAKGTITVIGFEGYSPNSGERKTKCPRITMSRETKKILFD
jgi:hypothetical protein